MTPRLQKLQQLLAKTPDDPFLLFAIGMEYKKLRQFPEALAWFAKTLQLDPGYCVAYHQSALAHLDSGDTAAARAAFEQGIAAARGKGDHHAAKEMEDALAMIR